MYNNHQTGMLSINELNNVLKKLQNNEEITEIGEFSEVDIVFIAGLFLWYMKHKDNWKKISHFFNITNINDHRAWSHSYYFKQIHEIYDVKHNDIFDNFPNANSNKANSFSKVAAPPIYITKESLECFFGKESDNRVQIIKDKYIENFDIADFINKSAKYYTSSKKKFDNYQTEIKSRLINQPPIFAFIFIIACKNLAEKKKETFENRKDYIEKLLLFTQDYTNGLYELAKNIVEHSGQNKQKGDGLITIRAYKESDSHTTRTLETHVFDYGKTGIVPKLIEYTKEKADTKSETNSKIKECYDSDYKFFINNRDYELRNFISPEEGHELKQQTFRHTSHYGINKLYKLIQKPLGGEIFVASNGLTNRNYFGENAENKTLVSGTHYYFKIPFKQENFKNIVAKPFPQETQTAMLGETASLSFLININIITKRLSQLSEIQSETEESLIDITIDEKKISKDNIDSIYKSLNKLHDIKNNNRIAINISDKFNDVSVLLRFLSHLSFEYKQAFIVYNVNHLLYKELLKDNEDFFRSRPSESYWHNEQALLLFAKTDQDFYFADILFGQNEKEFLFVNSIVSKTFPNTISLLQEKKKKGIEFIEKINSSQNLQQFFYPRSNNLLPFDAILKTSNREPIFVSNLTKILKNQLFNRADTYSSLDEYIDNFDGFHIINTHFKIGTKIHSEDFYYAKRLFQNSFYTARLAMLLAIKIKKTIDSAKKEVMLVGYEMYSELLLSLTEKFLKDFISKQGNKSIRINHIIAQSDDDRFKFLPDDTFKKYLKNCKNWTTIIIVPIAATGSTANKIENDIRDLIYQHEIVNKKPKQDSKNIADRYKIEARYNVLLAQPENEFESIKKSNINQTTIINLPATWHEIKECPLCYKAKRRTLFETDKSALTPALIFGRPKGKTILNTEKEIGINVAFDEINFSGSLKYKKVFRNNNYRIYYIESNRFVENNIEKIQNWLKMVKDYLHLIPTDKITLVSPCHESNSRFINLVNEFVFSSSATIIHHQSNVDFVENFKLLNKHYLGEGTKLFYVDDSLITGKHFYEIFDLVNNVVSGLRNYLSHTHTPFTASILLKDKSEPFTHNKVVEMSNLYFAFANFNQPPILNLLEQRPLEHERQRYEGLSKASLHDITTETFQNKADGLNPPKLNSIYIKEIKKDENKELRRLKNFEATHKIYDYFARYPEDEDYDIKNIVDFRSYSPNSELNLFPEFINDTENEKIEKQKDNPKALLKVLSQYPFILYQQLRKKTFDWTTEWLNEIKNPGRNCFTKNEYPDFQTTKFLLRRAALLGNYSVLEPSFLKIILSWFVKIDLYFTKKPFVFSTDLEDWEINMQDFPIYVLRNYVEMIQKNGWVAYHILDNIKNLESELQNSRQGLQFLCMLQIESAVVIDDFYEMIVKEAHFEWRNIFKKDTTLITKTEKIASFFDNSKKQFEESNKYLIVKETFLNNSDEWMKSKTPFIDYLWIKQLLFTDCIDKHTHFSKNIDYQRKIDAIMEKMKEFFSPVPVKAFFIVTDGQQKPYVLKEEQGLLSFFNGEFDTDQKVKDGSIIAETKNRKTQTIIDFLNGINCNTFIAPETTAEYFRNRSEKEIQDEFNKTPVNKFSEVISIDLFSDPGPNFTLAQWTDAYNNVLRNLPFMPVDSKWLYLMRITKRNEHSGKFDTLGMLGFYSSENLFNSSKSLFPKQLLMLLRRDIGKFIEKHHKSDEFSGLIQQKEKNKYIFRLNHGVSTYEDAITDIMKDCNDPDLKVNLETFYDYLITKLDLISKLSSETTKEPIDAQTIKEEFESKYEKILSLKTNEITGLKKNDVQTSVKLNFEGFDILKEKYEFPQNSIKDIVFELLNNIRKNVCNIDMYLITPTTPLIIDIAIVEHNREKYLSVTNNHVRNLDGPNQEEDVPHGIDLLRHMWNTHKLGKIITPVYPLKERLFVIKLQLKKFEE